MYKRKFVILICFKITVESLVSGIAAKVWGVLLYLRSFDTVKA